MTEGFNIDRQIKDLRKLFSLYVLAMFAATAMTLAAGVIITSKEEPPVFATWADGRLTKLTPLRH